MNELKKEWINIEDGPIQIDADSCIDKKIIEK